MLTRRARIIVGAMLAIGVGIFAVAIAVGTDNPPDISVTGDPAVERLIPARGDEVLQQSAVGIDLAQGYRLISLQVFPNNRFANGTEVVGQVEVVEGLNEYRFTPNDGQLIRFLAPDANCAIARYELIARPDEIGRIDWCFTVS